MKLKYFFIPVFFALAAGVLFSQVNYKNFNPGASSDTLLFDGDAPINLTSKADNCPVKVTYSKGTAKGKKIVQKKFQICVDQPGLMNVEEDGPLGPGDVLAPGSNITTGDNSAVELQFLDGSITRIGPNSNYTLGNCNFDDQQSSVDMRVILGSMYSAVQHALGVSTNQNVSTGNATAGVRGTKFSMDNYILNGDTISVLKVYEGTVEFRSSYDNSPDAQIINAKNQKLSEEYMAGKITMEEYMKRSAEANVNTLDIVSKYKVTVEAGFTSTVTGRGTPSEPKAFTADDNTWFADKNFGK